MELNLLEKTELRINKIGMRNVNLDKVAGAVAAVLALDPAEVLVVDVREDHICLDILRKTLAMRQVAGKEAVLLDRLKQVPGLTVTAETSVDSNGIMGLIGCDEKEAGKVIARTERMAGEIERTVLSRAMVYATGFEVSRRMIEDTNSPFLLSLLNELGYKTEFGGVLDDSATAIRRKLVEVVDRGFGLVVTTGGVGAEDKDFSVEAMEALDAQAVTPWLAKFEQGTGRHVKGGVRIGVGQTGLTTIVNLPGPHDEVLAAGAALRALCHGGRRIDKTALAEQIARILREKLRGKFQHHHHKEDGHGKKSDGTNGPGII